MAENPASRKYDLVKVINKTPLGLLLCDALGKLKRRTVCRYYGTKNIAHILSFVHPTDRSAYNW